MRAVGSTSFRGLARLAVVSSAAGFRDKDWAQKCLKLGWNYGIRVANNIGVTLADGRVLAINTLGVKPGQPRYFQNVRLTAEADWICNLAVTWTKATPKQPAELCAIAMNLPAGQRTPKDYLSACKLNKVSAMTNPAALIWKRQNSPIRSASIISCWRSPSRCS